MEVEEGRDSLAIKAENFYLASYDFVLRGTAVGSTLSSLSADVSSEDAFF